MKTICKHIYTSIGKIAVYIKDNKLKETPIIFLHGVYFDHLLWKQYCNSINDRIVITIDMPLHGKSQEEIKKNEIWVTVLKCWSKF